MKIQMHTKNHTKKAGAKPTKDQLFEALSAHFRKSLDEKCLENRHLELNKNICQAYSLSGSMLFAVLVSDR